jgi:hypothetical protein
VLAERVPAGAAVLIGRRLDRSIHQQNHEQGDEHDCADCGDDGAASRSVDKNLHVGCLS